MPLNQLFFGPPGTGKTYHTIDEAIKIVDPEFYNTNQYNRYELKKRFKDLLIKDWEKSDGQIAFCTFHQSFSYEDFVEGIKPVKPAEDDKYLKYRVEDGIFKKICLLSEDNRKSIHKIGHAYFMEIKTLEDLEQVFSNKVIPLLEEYFFGDFGKIGLVLGESFIEGINKEGFSFASFPAYDTTVIEDLKEKPVYKIKPSDAWDFVSIYK